MAKAIFTVLFKIIQGILNAILAPINLLVVNLLPDFSSMINTFNTSVSTYIGKGLAYFAYLLPPTTKQLISIYLLFLATYYTVTISVHSIIKIFKIIQRIKFW